MVFKRRPIVFPPGQAHSSESNLAQEIFGYWPCNEGGGLTVRDQIQGNDGVVHGTTGWVQSPIGPALSLDGSSSYVEIPNSFDLTSTHAITLALWLYWKASSEAYNSLFTNEVSGSWTWLLKSNQQPAFYNSGAGSDPIGTSIVPFNQWVHLVLTWGAANPSNVINVYMNGVLLDTNTLGNSGGTGTGVLRFFGHSPFGAGRFVNGYARDIAMWVRVLAAAEIRALYETPGLILAPRRRLWVSGPSGNQTITGSAGIPSAEAFGCLGGTVDRYGVQEIYAFCSSQGIPSGETFGVNGAVAVAPNLTGDAGIPSAEAFGTTGSVGTSPAITGQYGIPSAEAFGQGALIMRKGPAVFINNVDYTDQILIDTMHIIQRMSQAATAEFTFRDPVGTTHLQVGNEVLIYTSGPLPPLPPSNSGGFPYTRIFGGSIDDITESTEMALPTVRADVKCNDFSEILDKRIVGKYYTAAFGSLGIIVQDIVNSYLAQDGIHYNQVDGDPGINVGPQLFQWITARQVFNQLSNLTGWDFQIDYYKELRFFPKQSGIGASPFTLVDNDKNPIAESVMARAYRGKYRNKQGVRSSAQTSPLWQDIFSAALPGPYPSNPQPPDGVRFDFITLFFINQAPIINVNGTQVAASRVIMLSQVAGAAPGSWDWYWIPNGAGVFQNQGNPRLKSTDVLTVNYQAQLSPIIWVSCAAEIAARAAIEGNSGIYEDVQDVPNITDPTALKQYATALLNRYGCSNGIPREVKYKTYRDGLFVGQLQNINLSEPLVAALNYFITQVEIRDIQKQFLEYTITADSGLYLGDWTQFFAAIVDRGQQAQPGTFVEYDWALVPTIPGVVNPGLTGTGIFPLTRSCTHQVEIAQYFSVIANALPNPNPSTWQVLVNGNGIGFPLTATQAGIEYRFYFQQGIGQTQFFAGDVFQILVQGGASGSIRDVTCKLVTAISVA